MNKNKNFGIFLFILLIFGVITIPGAIAANTTIGDSSFPAEIDNVFTWRITKANQTDILGFNWKVGDKINLTIVNVTQGTFGLIPAIEIVLSIGYFNHTSNIWTTLYYNSRVFYNATLKQFFIPSFSFYDELFKIFLTPYPLNMTMIKLGLEDNGLFDLLVVSGNSINGTFIGTPNEYFVYTYNSYGQCSVYDWYYGTDLLYRLELENGDIPPTISFGVYFVLFTLISVVSLVLFIKKSKMRIKQ